jgi:glutamate/tyrosine decarboxylase-like PLP-dependent enzyme
MQRLAAVHLCIVCFRYRPPQVAPLELDELNRRLGAAIVADGRIFVGTTIYDGNVALRPALTNWRITRQEVEELVAVVRELGERLIADVRQ